MIVKSDSGTIKLKIQYYIIICVIIDIFIIIYSFNNTEKQMTPDEQETIPTSSVEEKPIEVIIEREKKEIDSSSTDWNLILINKDNPLKEGYEMQLEEIENGYELESRIIEPAKQMLQDARNEGLEPIICSAYRTNKYQTILYNNKVQDYINSGYLLEQAKEEASYWVTNPGTSEHEAGLCMDIISKQYQELDKNQENTDVQKWLMEHCYDYGFILRYPTDKSKITKINYEPWHYRYVGIENARFIKEKGFCLEEYIDYLKSYE